MSAAPKFVIQGVDYPVPEWVSFTLDESEILFDKAHLTLDQIDEDMKFTPGLLSAMLLVAYMRGNPNASRARAEKIVGGMKLTDAIEHLAGDTEDDALPPSSVPPTPDEQGSNGGSTTSSGDGSETSSESPDVVQLPTGTHGSDTLPVSDPVTSVG